MNIELTQEYIQSLFTYRNGFLYWKVNRRKINIGDKAGSKRKDEYITIKINYKSYLLHRIIYLYHHGYLPKYIDHKDRNKSNNNIENLRSVTQQQNNMNGKPCNNYTSQYKGVSWNKRDNKWLSRITINGKIKYLGQFKNEIDAAKAYNEIVIRLFNKYTYLNEV